MGGIYHGPWHALVICPGSMSSQCTRNDLEIKTLPSLSICLPVFVRWGNKERGTRCRPRYYVSVSNILAHTVSRRLAVAARAAMILIIVVRSGKKVHDGVHDNIVIFGQASLVMENLVSNAWILY